MKPSVVLAFDMDDTLCNTHREVYNRVMKYCLDNFLHDHVEYLESNPLVYFGDYEGELKEIVLREVIEKRVYMDTAEPTFLMKGLRWLLKELKLICGDDIKIVVCTHRGDNMSAWFSTYNYLKLHKVDEMFDMIHSIDSTVNKDKVNYLKAMYPESEILLVDDNPFGSKSLVRDPVKEVLMYGALNNFECHQNQEMFKDVEDLFERVCNMF